MGERILLFGGTFDPPHRAHVELPQLVAGKLGCDRIVYIPAAASPHKTDDDTTDAVHRLAMLRLALGDRPNVTISTIELDRGGVSYFVDTLRALRADLGDDVDLRFLVGADQALAFDRWKDPEEILRLATPAVMLRPREDLPDERWREWIVETPLIDVSATELREHLRDGRDVSDVLDPAVVEYIRAHGLYGL
ncbi:MAG: nicotinate (nicotinamide) nucleotide adenylyltransferase [Planctomycetota bacterium]|jgi:nicotinate-nucleotide adenylyltransferase